MSHPEYSSLAPEVRARLLAFLSGTGRWHLEGGDSLALLTHLPSASVDAVIADGPYSSGGMHRGDRAKGTAEKYIVDRGQEDTREDFEGDTRDQRAYQYWGSLWCAETYRVAKVGAPICLFTDWRQLGATEQALQAGGWVLRGILPWDKTEGARPQKGRFMAQCEYVAWGSKGPMPETRIGGACLPGFVRKMPTVANKGPSQVGKPIDVMRAVVRICEAEGVVLDPFAGGGSTGVAALLEGRRFLGFEMVAGILTDARKRLVDTVGIGPRDGAQLTITGSG